MEVDNVMDYEEEDLINQIEIEMRKIYLSVERLYNNASLAESSDPIEKCFVNNSYFVSSLIQKGIDDGLNRNEDMVKTFEESLQHELNCLTNDMETLLVKMNRTKEQFSRIDKNITELKAMMEAQEKEPKSEKKLDDVLRNLKLRFKKERTDLKTIVSSLFQDSSDVHDLIARIVENHFSEGADKYLQLEDSDNITEQIELLRRTRLFETNPHDPLQIRLADIL